MNTNAIRDFLKEYATNINQRQFDFVYRKWLFDDLAPAKILTELLYKSGVDPLNYTSTVPATYAAESNKVDSLVIPSNIKEIGLDAFKDSNLRQLTFSEPAQCRLIDHSAFAGTLIKRIIIPDSMGEIGVEAFQGCINLEEVSLPNDWGLKLLAGIFKDCTKLKSVQYRGTAEEYWLRVYGPNWTIGSSLKYIECSDRNIEL